MVWSHPDSYDNTNCRRIENFKTLADISEIKN